MNRSLSVAAGESNVLTPATSVNSQPQSEPPREKPSEARSPDSRPPEPPGQIQPPGEPVTPKASGKKPERPLSLRFLVCSLMMVASLFMVIWNLQEGSLENANTGSRYATIQSLIDYGTYHIDKSQYVRTIDKYKVGDHYISSKPPTLPTIGAGLYWVYKELTGKTIARYEGDVVRTISFFTGGACHILFLIYFYRLCRLLFRRQRSVIVTMAGACFAYLGVGYATHINELSTSGALAICGLYYAVRIRHEEDAKPWHWPLAGLVLGVMPAIDLPCLAITGGLALYLFTFDKKKTLLWFLPALLPGVLVHLALTYQISGSLRPFYFNSSLKAFKQFYFKQPGGIDGLQESKLLYAYNTLLGHHGLFSMTPLYCFGLYELVRCLSVRRLLAESLVAAGAVVAFLAFFILRTRNYGGWCVGMRWLVPIMPLLLLYFGVWIDRVRITRPLWVLVLLAFSVSCFNVQDALSSPFQYSVWHNWLEDAPNRGRVGKTFNLPRRPAKPKAKKPARPKTEPLPQAETVPTPPPPASAAPVPVPPVPGAGSPAPARPLPPAAGAEPKAQ
jgi:hypothetical protein